MTAEPEPREGDYAAARRAMHRPAHSRRTAAVNAAFFLPQLEPGMRLLDAGCGPGSITIGLATAVAPGETVGIDIDPDNVEMARRHAEGQGAENLRFEAADVLTLPLADASFDAAFMHAVLQHLADPGAALAELRRVLRPGGVIGVADADLASGLVYPPNALLDRANELNVRLRRHDGGTPDVGRRLRELLHGAGFEDIVTSVAASSTTTDGLASQAEFSAAQVEQPAIATHIVAAGLATAEELPAMAAAWRAWGNEPGAFWSGLWCQAIARAA